MGQEGRRGSPTSPKILPGGTPGRGGRQRNPGVFVRWLGSEVLFSRAGAPLHQGPATNLRTDNRVFPADSSLPTDRSLTNDAKITTYTRRESQDRLVAQGGWTLPGSDCSNGGKGPIDSIIGGRSRGAECSAPQDSHTGEPRSPGVRQRAKTRASRQVPLLGRGHDRRRRDVA